MPLGTCDECEMYYVVESPGAAPSRCHQCGRVLRVLARAQNRILQSLWAAPGDREELIPDRDDVRLARSA